MFGKGVYFADVGHWCGYDVISLTDSYNFPDDVEGAFAVCPQCTPVANRFAQSANYCHS